MKLIPATALAVAIAVFFPISANEALPRFWPFFYATGFAFSLAHWFALARLCDILFSKNTFKLFAIGSLAFFTLSLELALCFVAVKTSRILLLPTAIAIVIVPASVTAYCLGMGILGILRGRRT